MADGRRILIVDDNVAGVKMLAMLLAKLDDHEIEIAYDGPTALAKISEFRPHLVLLDIGLPGMDGYQVAREMRQNDDFEDVLLIALTGYGKEEDCQRAKEAGFDQHLLKPPAVEQIREILAHPKLVK